MHLHDRMMTGRFGRLAFILGLAVSASAAGCFLSEEETDDSGDQVVAGGELADVLKSTLILDTGCTAAKVGPRHLLQDVHVQDRERAPHGRRGGRR